MLVGRRQPGGGFAPVNAPEEEAVSPAAMMALTANPTGALGGPQLSAANRVALASRKARPIFGARMTGDTRAPGVVPEITPGFDGFEPMSFGGTQLDPAALQAPVDISKTKVRGPAFNEPGGWGERIQLLAASLMNAGGNPMGAQSIYQRLSTRQRQQFEQRQQQAMWSRQDAQRAEDRQWQVEDRDARQNAPQYFMSGRDRVQYNPATGDSSVVYDGPEDYEAYAGSLGLQPGDEGYDTALQDFVLRSGGPTAMAGREALEGVRQANRVQMRGVPTYRDLHPRAAAPRAGGDSPSRQTMAGTMAPILAKVSRGETLTPGEQQAWSMYRPRRAAKGGQAQQGSADNPVPVTTRDEAMRLPAGTYFRNPQGKVMRR